MRSLHRAQSLFHVAAALATAATLLTACGGGGSSAPIASEPPPPAPSPSAGTPPSPAPSPGTSPAPSPSPSPAPAPSPTPAPSPAPTPAPSPAPTPAPSPAPAPAPAAAASECFNPAQFAAGTTYQLDYTVSGAVTGTSSTTGNIGANTTYNGTSNLIPITQTVVTNYTAPTAVNATVNMTAYMQVDGLDILSYATVATVSVPFVGNMETKQVFSPAARDKRFTLNAGESTVFAQTYTTTVTPPGTTSNTTASPTVTYVGQESVTVPAGTFTACKFNQTFEGSTSTTWIIKGSGVMAKSTDLSSNTTLQLQSTSRLNGSPL